jgi:hypothetical protein
MLKEKLLALIESSEYKLFIDLINATIKSKRERLDYTVSLTEHEQLRLLAEINGLEIAKDCPYQNLLELQNTKK